MVDRKKCQGNVTYDRTDGSKKKKKNGSEVGKTFVAVNVDHSCVNRLGLYSFQKERDFERTH